jgi:hypothetical protein
MPRYKILPHVYLASFEDAKEFEGSNVFLINCTKDLPMIHTTGGGTRLNVDDHPSSAQTMGASLGLMVRYIEDHVNSSKDPSLSKDVVVHCFAGQQRSATVVAAYVMRQTGWTPEQTVEYIKSKKPDAFLGGAHFMDQLKNFVV